jgi:AbrB family looped-hinge helix DNA binding protein
MTITVTSKGQVTLPVEARKKLGIQAGSRLEVLIHDDGRMELIHLKGSVRDLKGILPRPAKAASLEDMERAVAEGALHSLK